MRLIEWRSGYLVQVELTLARERLQREKFHKEKGFIKESRKLFAFTTEAQKSRRKTLGI